MDRREQIIEAIATPESLVCEHTMQMQIRMVDGLIEQEIIELLRACTSVLASRILGLDNPLIVLRILLEQNDERTQQDQFYAAVLDVAQAHLDSVIEGVKNETNDS